MSKVKLNKVEVKVSKVVIDKEDGIHREDKRKYNTGSPVDRTSARYKRLQKQALYAKVNKLFVSGKPFTLGKNQSSEYHYTPNADNNGGSLFNGIGSHECNINYIGRTKVTGYTYVLDKRVNVEINLKSIKFTK